MRDPLPPKEGSSQMTIRTEMRYCLVLLLKNQRPRSPIRVSGETGEARNCSGGFGWKHPTKTRKFSDT